MNVLTSFNLKSRYIYTSKTTTFLNFDRRLLISIYLINCGSVDDVLCSVSISQGA